MCQTTVVSSPLGPLAGRFALGVGAVAGLPLAARLAPATVAWMAGALALTTAWAAVATIVAIRQRANTAVAAPQPQTRAPRRAHAQIIAGRPAQTTLPATAARAIPRSHDDPAEAFVLRYLENRCRTEDDDAFVTANEQLVAWIYRRQLAPHLAGEIRRAAGDTPHADAVRHLLKG